MITYIDELDGKSKTVYKIFQYDYKQIVYIQRTKLSGAIKLPAKRIKRIIEGEIEYRGKKSLTNPIVEEEKTVQEEYTKILEQKKEESSKPNVIQKQVKINALARDNTSQIFIYTFEEFRCVCCGNKLDVLTYLLYNDDTDENLTYPWDMKRLNAHRSPDLKYKEIQVQIKGHYPIKTLGSDAKLDLMLLAEFPKHLRKFTDQVKYKRCPMNRCQHCRNEYENIYLRDEINRRIRDMEPLKLLAVLKNPVK